ncbi:MAG: DUF4926 domain-containing protein [Saprospiraceae bacterium]|nr:DUF4926 domain-containing protein [Saprospiraceae bacterium]
MQQIPLYSLVSLKVDLPKYGLKAGDVVTVVEYLSGNASLPNAYICEASNAVGENIAVFTIQEDQVGLLNSNEVLHTRIMEM